MSDAVRDLLTRGVAAAKAGEKKEARFYLEWVIRREDAEGSQRAQAYLWLSEVSDDPAERRNCLEEVLALEPGNALARRGMAILQGRLRPEDIIDHRRPVQPAAPAPVTQDTVRRYVCPKCGGKMTYAADHRAVQCERCGHRMWEYDAITHGLQPLAVAEQDFVATLPTARAHRWELASVRTLTCQGCGANVTLPPAHAAGSCPFCSSAHVVVGQETRELIGPDGVLPFQVNADRALQLVRDWLKQQRFRPDDLDKRAMIDDPAAVYLPYWTFDIGGAVECTVMVPEQEIDDSGAELVLGMMIGTGGRRYRHEVRWIPQNFSVLVDQDDLLVPASRSLSNDILEKLTPFDTSVLVPYEPVLLSDWPAEIYQLTMADASVVAREKVVNDARGELKQQAGTLYPGYRDPSVNTLGILIESYKLALLPAWVSGYRYQGQRYVVAINGQTGEVVGNVPRGGVQKLLARVFGDGSPE